MREKVTEEHTWRKASDKEQCSLCPSDREMLSYFEER